MALLPNVVDAVWLELQGVELVADSHRIVQRHAVELDTAVDGWRQFDVARVPAPVGEPHAPVLVRLHEGNGVAHCSCTVFATHIICCHIFTVLFSPAGLDLDTVFDEKGPIACASQLSSLLRGTRWVGESCAASSSINVVGSGGGGGGVGAGVRVWC